MFLLHSEFIHRTIVELMKSRKKDGFSLFFGEFGATIYGIGISCFKSVAVAEAYTISAVSFIWKHIHEYDEKQSFSLWVFGITRRLALQHSRRRQIPEFSYSNSETRSDRLPSITMKVPAEVQEQYVNHQVLDALWFYGFSMEELSIIMEDSIPNLSKQIKQSFTELRTSMPL